MRAVALLVALLLFPACARSTSQLDDDFTRARQAMWRGELVEAQALADRGVTSASAESNPVWHWRFRLLSGQLAILRRDFPAAEKIAKVELPDAPAFDALRARQRWLAAYLQVEQGNPKGGHETLAAARQFVHDDPEVALEIDRLDGQALLRLGDWTRGEALLNSVLKAAAEHGDQYVQAIALNDLGMGRFVRSRYDEALQYFTRVTEMQDAREWAVYTLSSRN